MPKREDLLEYLKLAIRSEYETVASVQNGWRCYRVHNILLTLMALGTRAQHIYMLELSCLALHFHRWVRGGLQDVRKYRDGVKNVVFWDVALCRSCVNRRFGGTYRFHLQGKKIRER
jgi:hypothetical protein